MAPMLRERENTLLEADIEKLQAGLDTLATKIKQASAQQDTLRASIEGSDEIIRVLSQRLKMRSDLEKEGWESHANV